MVDWSPSGSTAPSAPIWGPDPVKAPTRGRSGEAELVRLRVRDRPGSLAAISVSLARYGVDVLGLEVLDRDGGFAVDDLLVTGGGLDAALAELEPDISVLARRCGIDLADPALAMAVACRALTSATSVRDTFSQLLGAALGLVFAEAGFVSVREGGGVLRPMASTVAGLPALDDEQPSLLRSALWSGDCLTADGRVSWVAESYRERLPRGTVAVIPSTAEPAFALGLVRDDAAPFVTTELNRLAALTAVAAGTFALHRVAEPLQTTSVPAATAPFGGR
jgi:hypothetical protein